MAETLNSFLDSRSKLLGLKPGDAPSVIVVDPTKCKHENALPHFDAEKARGLSAEEVRRYWPRGTHCPDCGSIGAFYASFEHMLAGDY